MVIIRPRPGSYILAKCAFLNTCDLAEVVHATNAMLPDQSRRDCIFIETDANNDHATPAGVVHFGKMRISIKMRPRWGRSCDQYDQSRRYCMFIETYVDDGHATPAGVVHFLGMIYSINMRPRWGRLFDQCNHERPIPEGLHIYRNVCQWWLCDPGRGRTFWQNAHFYTHATSLRSFMRPMPCFQTNSRGIACL